MSVRFIATTSVAALALLGLAGCAPGASDSTGGGSDDTAAPTTEPVAGPECLVGDWLISDSEMNKFYAMVGEATGTTFTIEGDTTLTFTTDQFTYTPDFSLVMTTAGVDATGRLSGPIAGAYTATDDTITTDVTSSDAHMFITVGGIEQDVTEQFGDAVTGAPFNNSPYRCTADGPILGFTIDDTHNVELQLTRR
jgi:hypothetical protein